MGNWTAKKVPITAEKEDLTESEGQFQGEGSVKLDDCPFKRDVWDEAGKVVGVECADDSAVRPCEPGVEDCRLQQWMESVKDFIRSIDVSAL
ncbi:MAG: hypothetical protein JSU72_07445 [Deltaproteobacteria bacterium]|nr:MAG: hypothetical protein JSU72_07445 [Deltaproteobacteria bacterium]